MALTPNSNLFDEKLNLLMDLQGRKPFLPRTYGSLISSFMAILLIEIEMNPGPTMKFECQINA